MMPREEVEVEVDVIVDDDDDDDDDAVVVPTLLLTVLLVVEALFEELSPLWVVSLLGTSKSLQCCPLAHSTSVYKALCLVDMTEQKKVVSKGRAGSPPPPPPPPPPPIPPTTPLPLLPLTPA